jgi:hypothetical protein
MKLKINTNAIKDENVRLRTRVLALETELIKKERFIDDIIVQRQDNGSASKIGRIKIEVIILPNSIVTSRISLKMTNQRIERRNYGKGRIHQ